MSNCQGGNVELENPPTHKRPDDVSRGNFGMNTVASSKYFQPSRTSVMQLFNKNS